MSALIQDLRHPAALPDPSENVRVVQTHISVVLVGDRYVYKIKKPVNFGFLDFSTPAKRHYYCRREIELNSRLSTDVYLDVRPITYDGRTHRFGGPGQEVDYAVRMKRIPEERLMKSLFQRGRLSEPHLNDLAQRLTRFHQEAAGGDEISIYGRPERFRVNTDENFQQVEKYIGVTLSREQFETLHDWTNRYFEKHRDLFLERVRRGKIRDCHGDLHMEHVCFLEPLAVIDCIEFNERFRFGDVICDIAFLLMDLEYHGGGDLSARLWDGYKTLAGETAEADSLVNFYKVYRAVVRGKVNSFQVGDPTMSPKEREAARQQATRYFDLACTYV